MLPMLPFRNISSSNISNHRCKHLREGNHAVQFRPQSVQQQQYLREIHSHHRHRRHRPQDLSRQPDQLLRHDPQSALLSLPPTRQQLQQQQQPHHQRSIHASSNWNKKY